jgi:hypothetical protein
MAKYRKKPVIVDGFKVADLLIKANKNWNALPQLIVNEYEKGNILFLNTAIIITTLEGKMRAELDDVVLIGVKG